MPPVNQPSPEIFNAQEVTPVITRRTVLRARKNFSSLPPANDLEFSASYVLKSEAKFRMLEEKLKVYQKELVELDKKAEMIRKMVLDIRPNKVDGIRSSKITSPIVVDNINTSQSSEQSIVETKQTLIPMAPQIITPTNASIIEQITESVPPTTTQRKSLLDKLVEGV